ncbi:MAG: magnesium chelatase subunit D [Pseudomonadota bacterium]
MSDRAWDRAIQALAALAVDPGALGGIVLRARVGPVRALIEAALPRLPGPQTRIHPTIDDSALFGGLNVAASLAEGRAVHDPGLAATPARLILPMAERVNGALAARLGQMLDAGTGHSLILFDEGAEPEETVSAALMERLAFFVDLNAVAIGTAQRALPAPGDLDAARALLPTVAVPDEALALMTALAAQFSIASLRAPRFAWAAARAFAALAGRRLVEEADITAAAELVYAHRATQIPEEAPPPEPPQEDDPGAEAPEAGDDDAHQDLFEEQLIEAVRALLPPDLLERLAHGRLTTNARGSGAGDVRRGNRRGRPLPSRPGRLDGRARIDVVATLRAAAPWQKIRRRARDTKARLILYPSDIRLKRFEEKSDRLLVFAVDASGSAAAARLNEAKGAVEMLLAQAYARRDHVAVIGFRGQGAELLLPPTRSLVQAKRRLSALPGGGGTPLAAGLHASLHLADQARGRGLSPALVLLTDGRANVALSGDGGRPAARADAEAIAAGIRAQGLMALVIDTAIRPGEASATLAANLGGQYFALPRADSDAISRAITAALE